MLLLLLSSPFSALVVPFSFSDIDDDDDGNTVSFSVKSSATGLSVIVNSGVPMDTSLDEMTSNSATEVVGGNFAAAVFIEVVLVVEVEAGIRAVEFVGVTAIGDTAIPSLVSIISCSAEGVGESSPPI